MLRSFTILFGWLLIIEGQAMAKTEEAIFAMGCFWCGESEFRDHKTNQTFPGIENIRVGYACGTLPNPTYENHPGYIEAVKVTYNPDVITYAQLLDIFWRNVDPFDEEGQFCDKGDPYKAVIFTKDETQSKLAEASKLDAQKKLGKNVVTEIKPYTTFYDAEEYHQNYKAKNPLRYKYYRWNCGRDARLKEVWGQVSSSHEKNAG